MKRNQKNKNKILHFIFFFLHTACFFVDNIFILLSDVAFIGRRGLEEIRLTANYLESKF